MSYESSGVVPVILEIAFSNNLLLQSDMVTPIIFAKAEKSLFLKSICACKRCKLIHFKPITFQTFPDCDRWHKNVDRRSGFHGLQTTSRGRILILNIPSVRQ